MDLNWKCKKEPTPTFLSCPPDWLLLSITVASLSQWQRQRRRWHLNKEFQRWLWRHALLKRDKCKWDEKNQMWLTCRDTGRINCLLNKWRDPLKIIGRRTNVLTSCGCWPRLRWGCSVLAAAAAAHTKLPNGTFLHHILLPAQHLFIWHSRYKAMLINATVPSVFINWIFRD